MQALLACRLHGNVAKENGRRDFRDGRFDPGCDPPRRAVPYHPYWAVAWATSTVTPGPMVELMAIFFM